MEGAAELGLFLRLKYLILHHNIISQFGGNIWLVGQTETIKLEYLMVGPLRGGELTTTSCSETSSAKETPLARETRFSLSPKLDLLSVVLDCACGDFLVVVLDLLSSPADGLDGGVFFPVES